MNRRALSPDQALDARGLVEEAIGKVRGLIKLAPDVGPVLVAAYRALHALGELRETIDSLSTIERDERPT